MLCTVTDPSASDRLHVNLDGWLVG